MDTRTPRPSTGGAPRGFADDEPVLSMVKVPSDPGQVVVNHVSFRVLLPEATPRSAAVEEPWRRATAGLTAAVPTPAASGSAARAGGIGRRRAPVVWSGRTRPGDTGTKQLLQAVRVSPTGFVPTAPQEPFDAATQTLPRVHDVPPGAHDPHTAGRRRPVPPDATQPLHFGVPPAREPYESYADGSTGGPTPFPHQAGGPTQPPYTGTLPLSRQELPDAVPTAEETRSVGQSAPRRNEPVRHAFYPGRRMNLGVVLLPLRLLLGFVSVYAGMSKLCDPVYFDAGPEGTLVPWLRSLEPWALASPLHEFALAHPAGAGLTVAFLQVIVGVLTIFGLWQRLAAGVGAALSLALLVTVAWRSVPVYDAPDMLYLAAWSPLIIAGAPVYSLDGRLASEAWRTLGPRAELGRLRRRVLRRGALTATVVVGLSLLVGATLGGAVRSSDVPRVPEPGEPPVNHLPGSPMPQESAGADGTEPGTRTPPAEQSPDASTSSPGAPGEEPGESDPTGGQDTVEEPESPAVPEEPSAPTAPGTGGTGPSGDDGSSGGTATGGASGGSSGGSSGGGEPDRGGALGGLLG